MEKNLKKIEEFFKKNPDADFDKLDLFLSENFTSEEKDKYYEMLGNVMGGLDKIMEDPMANLINENKKKQGWVPCFFIIPIFFLNYPLNFYNF